MSAIKAVFDFITGFGPSVMMPIIITLLGLALGAKFGKALRAGITVGIGFIGINVIIGLLFRNFGPAVEAMVKNWGIKLTAIDVGWSVGAAIAFGTRIGSVIFIVGLLTNFVMLALKLTKTVDVDLWNYWHWAYTGSLVYVATGNFLLGIVAAIIHAAYSLKVGDLTAPTIQKYFGWPDLSICQGWATTSMILIWPIFKLLDVLGIDKTSEAAEKGDLEKMRERMGIVGEPVIIGLIMGLVIGLLAYATGGLGFKDLLTKVLVLAMDMAAVMLLMPRVVAILMEGLIPLSEQAREFLQKRFAGREFYIGMDSALLIGEPLTLTVGFILVPITLILAAILPGNHMLPFGDLSATPFFIAMVAPFAKGRFWRTLITGIIMMIVITYMGSIWAPLVTAAGKSVGYAFPSGAAQITGFGNPLGFILVMIFKTLFGR
jgi:PTS system galactitol-specific IIC component